MSNDKITKLKRIKQILNESAQNSTSHGIPNIFRNQNWFLKIIWLIAFLVSTGYCLKFIVFSILDYYDYPVVTKISVKSQIPLELPTITICNMNPFTNDFAYNFVDKTLAENGVYEYSDIEKFGTSMNFQTVGKMKLLKYFISVNLMKPNISDETRQKTGYSINDMLISCLYNMQNCLDVEFEWIFVPYFGNCFKFNSGKNISGHSNPPKVTTKSGHVHGVSMEFFVGEPTHKYSFSFNNGAHIFIGDKSIRPTLFEGFEISTGVQTNIALKKVIKRNIPSPYSDCIKDIQSYDSELTKIFNDNGYYYRQRDCFDLCLKRYIAEVCNCNELVLSPYSFNKPPCITLTQVSCASNQFTQFFKDGINKTCENDCPLECEETIYSLSTSFTEYPTENYAILLRREPVLKNKYENISSWPYEKVKRNVLSFNIYFDDLQYTLIEDYVKTTPEDLLSSVGGTLGLFIGVSFLSTVEFIEIFVNILFVLFEKDKRNVIKVVNNL